MATTLMGAALWTALAPSADERSRGPSPEPASAREAAPPRESLLYARGTELRLFDLAAGDDRLVGRLPGPDVWASTSGRLAYLASGGKRPEGGAEVDFVPRSEVHVLELDGLKDRNLGPGVAPLWGPDGRSLAYLRPDAPRDCEGESCSGEVEVVVHDLTDPRPTVVLEAGRWFLLGWSGDRLLVSQEGDPDTTLSVALDGSVSALGVPPSEMWAASPDGRWVVTAPTGAAAVRPLLDGAVAGPGVIHRLDGAVLAEGQWAPDSSMVAAVRLDAGDRGVGSRLVTLAPGTNGPTTVPGTSGAAGQVLWGPGGRVVFARTASRGRRLEAVMCDLAGPAACRPLFSWARGVTLLALLPGSLQDG